MLHERLEHGVFALLLESGEEMGPIPNEGPGMIPELIQLCSGTCSASRASGG
jgi:hypothetical protein